LRLAASIAAALAFFSAFVHRLRAEPEDDKVMAFVKATEGGSPFSANEGLMLLIGAGAVLTAIVALFLVVYRLNRKTAEALDEIEARLDSLEGSDG
jgi:hypothetical protein